jgi:hypothetical protein
LGPGLAGENPAVAIGIWVSVSSKQIKAIYEKEGGLEHLIGDL